MLMIKIEDYEILSSSKSTLKATSKDDESGEFMTQSEIEVIDFDKVKEKYQRKIKSDGTPSSNDALFICEDKIYFIEFKNGVVNQRNVRLKMFDSLWMFTDIIEQKISFIRTNVKYILVYNKAKNPSKTQSSSASRQIKRHVMKKANDRLVDFGLKSFEKLYINELYTYTEEEFEEEFVKKYSS